MMPDSVQVSIRELLDDRAVAKLDIMEYCQNQLGLVFPLAHGVGIPDEAWASLERKCQEPGGFFDTRQPVPRGVARARAEQEGDPIFVQALAILERDRSGAPLGLPRLPTQA